MPATLTLKSRDLDLPAGLRAGDEDGFRNPLNLSGHGELTPKEIDQLTDSFLNRDGCDLVASIDGMTDAQLGAYVRRLWTDHVANHRASML